MYMIYLMSAIFIVLPFLILFVVLFLPSILRAIKDAIKQKYEDFLRQHSIALRELNALNARYSFYSVDKISFTHTYDNENFFEQISCLDYLIYQLQFKRREIFDQLPLIDSNKATYISYAEELKKISQIGRYDAPSENFKLQKMLQIEKSIYDKEVLHPITEFNIPVALYCSTLNGRIYSNKGEIFSREVVLDILQRLRNKNGTFFNDRYIWDAICRVERGRVSNKMRFSIYNRDGNRCRICGVSGNRAPLEIDHIIPIAKGGKSTYDNLQTLCHRCNVEKGSYMPYGTKR